MQLTTRPVCVVEVFIFFFLSSFPLEQFVILINALELNANEDSSACSFMKFQRVRRIDLFAATITCSLITFPLAY